MPAFVLKGLTVYVAPPRSHENPSREPLVVLILKDDESQRDVKIPWRAWLSISQHVAKAGSERMSGYLEIPLLEHVKPWEKPE